MNLIHHTGIMYKNGSISEIDDAIVCEDTFTLLLNECPLLTMVASDDHLRELGAGFVISSGIADRIESVTVIDENIYVEAPVTGEYRAALESSGGYANVAEPPEVFSTSGITPEKVLEVRESIDSDAWLKTGALHASVLFYKGELAVRCEDIGRHNSVDKVVGHAVLNNLPLSDCVIGCTGRQPSGMVQKAANAGIPIIISRAASTDQGIAMAEKTGITLICFTREGRFTVYTHPERITGLGQYGKVK
ncbi:formate dehydrogenase accessory sulfurtransferase FdhD [Methanocalculus taiwanensis]|uniref:Formate dehydrogenase accessory sulfurtransferase FdhD n=1 Tax=Methanocalculus taiwanensis TaxID=106207 RepID=A0ABD4TH47_9EURY|nr:formate dehydrogenase accessory sulfurtransferase FdhD [Methanocalculus taiwanensis]MCQ1538006.1 formate dehydrogenase accessory sulfurtransferase FdhD [Methanocalculus taiwanensis]